MLKDNKRVFPMRKPVSPIVKIATCGQSCSNYLIIVCIVTILACLVYVTDIFNDSTNSFPGFLTSSKDLSSSYNVKVFPSSLSDTALGSLPREAYSYLAIVDAGSSGCRAHVYRYGKLDTKDGHLYILPQHISKKVKPGLSSFAKSSADAGPSLAGLIEFIKSEVPESDWKNTPIWVMATAGLRMLDAKESEAILNSVRSYLTDTKNSPFIFRKSWARVILGTEEGGFGWIAYNYLKKVIGPKRNKDIAASPYAVVEMGGASTQVSQLAPTAAEAQAIPLKYRFVFEIEGKEYTLYTHSYLGYGAEQAREGLNKALLTNSTASSSIQDPCINKGYTRTGKRKDVYEGADVMSGVVGYAGNDQCYQSLVESLSLKQDSSSQCSYRFDSKSFGCNYQPNFVTESPNFLIFENFYYVSSAVGMYPDGTDSLNTTPGDFMKASADVCNMDWNSAVDQYPKNKEGKDSVVKWCFGTSYAASFLMSGLHLPKDKHVIIQREVNGSEIEWALGAAYKEAASFLKLRNLRPT